MISVPVLPRSDTKLGTANFKAIPKGFQSANKKINDREIRVKSASITNTETNSKGSGRVGVNAMFRIRIL